jgi:hypothetical protein
MRVESIFLDIEAKNTNNPIIKDRVAAKRNYTPLK